MHFSFSLSIHSYPASPLRSVPSHFLLFFSLSKTQVGLCLPLLVSTMREQCQEKGKVEEREDKKTQVERHGVCLAGHLAEDESKLVEFCGNC